jgi:catalase
MIKPTPNPPEADQASPRTKSKAKKHDEATNRVLDYYLLPKSEKSENASQPGQLFTVAKNADNESLLANLSETLASADAMVSNLAFDLEGPRRHIALGVQQLIELSSLLANRVLDNVDPR